MSSETTTKYSTNITKRGDDSEESAVTMTLGLTDNVLDKADRFLEGTWLRYEICRLVERYPEVPEQEYYRHGDTNEFHLVFPIEDYVIVLVDKYEHIVAITQMHRHFEYDDNELFRYVDETRWHKRFDNRQPASERKSSGELALETDLDEMTRTFPAPADVATPTIQQ